MSNLAKKLAAMPREKRSYSLQTLPTHLVSAGYTERAKTILLDFDFLQAKLYIANTIGIIEDCKLLDKDKTFALLISTLQASLYVLNDTPTALAHQLVGRLVSHKKSNEQIKKLLDEIVRNVAGFYPLNDTYVLNQATNDYTVTTMRAWAIRGAIELSNGYLLSWGQRVISVWEEDGSALRLELQGHESTVFGVLETKDGCLLSWSDDGTLRLWSSDYKFVRVLEGHVGAVTDAIETKDGRFLSWGTDATLRLWSSDGALISVMRHGTDPNQNETGLGILGALELRNGSFLSWMYEDFRMWSKEGQPLTTLEVETKSIDWILELRDGRLLLSDFGELRPLKLDDNLIVTLDEHDFCWGALQLSDERLVTWSRDSIYIWSKDGRLITKQEGLPSKILDGTKQNIAGTLELINGDLLTWGETLCMWKSDGEFVRSLDNTDSVDGALQLSNGNLLSWDRQSLRLWTDNGNLISTLEGHADDVKGAMEIANGRVLSWGADSSLRLWNLPELEGTTTSNTRNAIGHRQSVDEILQLNDGRYLSWSSLDNSMCLWNANGDLDLFLEDVNVDGVFEMRDGRLLSWGWKDLYLWSKDGGLLTTLVGSTHLVEGALELRDGRLLSWGWKNLYIWSMDDYTFSRTRAHTAEIRGALESSTGHLLTWSEDCTLCLWTLNGKMVTSFSGHSDAVLAAIEVSGDRFLSWSADCNIRLWAKNGRSIATFEGHTAYVDGVLEVNYQRFLSWSRDGTFRLWSSSGLLIDLLEEHYDWGNHERIFAWAGKHNIDVTSIYVSSQNIPMPYFLVNAQLYSIKVFHPKDGRNLTEFICDAGITTRTLSNGIDIIVAGNQKGHVLFLCPNDLFLQSELY